MLAIAPLSNCKATVVHRSLAGLSISAVTAVGVRRLEGIILLGKGDCAVTFPLASTTRVMGSYITALEPEKLPARSLASAKARAKTASARAL